jgi:hypothetical protein
VTSRRDREGWYVGTWAGKHVRRRAMLDALMVGDVEVLPVSIPFPDSGIAWLTMNARSPVPPVLPLRIRYRSKGIMAEVVLEEAGPDVETSPAPCSTEDVGIAPTAMQDRV